jgi:hypothetical protein
MKIHIFMLVSLVLAGHVFALNRKKTNIKEEMNKAIREGKSFELSDLYE